MKLSPLTEAKNDKMASCTFPTSSTAWWSGEKDFDQAMPDQEWQDQPMTDIGEDESSQVSSRRTKYSNSLR